MKTYYPLTYGLLALLSHVAVAQTKLEAISDVDESALTNLPEIDWSKDPFKRTPGFAKTVTESETAANAQPTVNSLLEEIHKQHRGAETPTDKGPVLDAVIFSEENPSAIINGEVLSVGEYVNDRKIAEVGRNYVLLEEDKSTIELTLPPAKEIPIKLEIKELPHEK